MLWVVDDYPSDDFTAGRSGQRAFVSEQFGGVQFLEQVHCGNFRCDCLVAALNLVDLERRYEVVGGVAACFDVEEHSDHGVLVLAEVMVHEVDLQVVVIAVEGVLGGRVYVELQQRVQC